MRILSVNCAIPELVEINGKPVKTGIYKKPHFNAVAVGELGLSGDDQADKRVHGGPDQAVYCYSAKHYAHWQDYLNVSHLPNGTFGENLTLYDMDEEEICIGDTLQISQVLLQVTKPRIPCFKLAHKLGSKTVIKDFLHSGFSGFYCRVLQTGTIATHSEVKVIQREAQLITVKQALILQKLDPSILEDPAGLLQNALEIASLTDELKADFSKRLKTLT